MSAGRDSLAAPAGIAVLFICATAGLLLWTLGEFRSRSQAALGGMVLLGTPFFAHLSFAQYADVPLAFFFLATMSLLFCYSRRPDHSKDEGKDGGKDSPKGGGRERGTDGGNGNPKAGSKGDGKNLLVLAGLIAGLSAWVKNEGLVFFLAISITYFLFSWRIDGRGDAARRLRSFAFGGAGPIVLALLFKLTFAGTNALVATQGRAGLLRKLLMPNRYAQVLEGFGYHLYHLASWPESVLLILAIYAVLIGVRIDRRPRVPVVGIDRRDRVPMVGIDRRDRAALLACVSTLLIMLAVYFLVLVGSPYDTPPFDVSWYILVTAPRLFMQLWPCFLLVFFLTVRTPDDIIVLLRLRPSSPM